MSRYIDTDKLTVYFEALAKQAEMEGLYNMAHIHNRCLQIIKDAPTADVVEVVRCKDCWWWEAHTYGSTIGRCENPRNGLVNEYSDDTDYCSYGERGENER